MELEEIRIRFAKRITLECRLFKRCMMKKSKSYLYSHAYWIDSILAIYEILAEEYENYPQDVLVQLLSRGRILESFYRDWLKQEDSRIKELSDSIHQSIRWRMKERRLNA